MTTAPELRRYVCPRCGEVAATPGACRRDGEALEDADDDELLGVELGGYRIAAAIGRGGMGTVYRGVQPMIDAEVAIKVLSRELVGERETSERFVSEARIANRVRHEGLVKVLSIGLTADNRPYLIMEHLTGAPLSTLIGAKLPLGTLLRRLAEAARAIAAMHTAGVIHRDLKPSNLFVTTAGFIKVLDFGIAKLADERSGLTRTGHTIGTPGYMSPEQAQGDPIDGRSDIYALGVVLYETAVGKRPFEGRVVEALATGEAPPALPDSLPRALDAIVQRAMAHDPGRRFATTSELADALDAVSTDEAGPLLDAPLAVPVTAPIETVKDRPSVARLGRYLVEGTAGRGGEGVVLIGRDPKVQRQVALKLLDAGDRRDRIIAEAQAMARINHPNVVTLYELGEDGDQLFLAMEYLEAIDLENWLAEPRTWREILTMFVAAGAGLAAAHEVGVVHRDFKPANVLLGKDGRPRVGDFGIAEVGASTGDAAGTAVFMAPEQVEGGRVDARADQFSFCASLWLALYGEAPYPGATAVAIAIAAQRGQLREPHGDAPAALHGVLKRGLAAAPSARFSTMPALLSALERAASPRRRWPWLGAGALVLGAATLVVATREHAPTLDEVEAITDPAERLRALVELPREPDVRARTLDALRQLVDPSARIQALARLPADERTTDAARLIARDAMAHGFVRRVQLDGDPVAEAAAFAGDTLIVPIGDRVIAVDPSGASRVLATLPLPPRRLAGDARELRMLVDDQILATPLDRTAWQPVARCDYEVSAGRRAEANADLTVLACVGARSRILIDGKRTEIELDVRDSVAFSANRIAIRRSDEIEVFDRTAARIGRKQLVATHHAVADEVVAYITDGKLEAWDPVTDATAPSNLPADRVAVTGGVAPAVFATAAAGIWIAHVERSPALALAETEMPRAITTRIAGSRVIETSATEVIVRDFAVGRAWRQRGAPGQVVADATGTRVASFDGRAVRLWTIDSPPAVAIPRMIAQLHDELAIVSQLRRTALRAYDLRGRVVDALPETDQLLPSANTLLVARDGKSLRWDPTARRVRDVADHPLGFPFASGDELYEHRNETIVRVRDGAPTGCTGGPQQVSRDGSTVLLFKNPAMLTVCHLPAGVPTSLAIEPELDPNRPSVQWRLSPDGARAAAIDSRRRLTVYDTQTGKRLALPTEVAQLVALEVVWGPGTKLLVSATRGLVTLDGTTATTLSTEASHKDPRFSADGSHVISVSRGRLLAWTLPDPTPHELGELAPPSDARTFTLATTDHAIGRVMTGVSVVFPFAPPEVAIVEGWYARFR